MNMELYRSAVNDIKVNQKLVKELAVKMKEKQVNQNRQIRFGVLVAAMAILIASVFSVQNLIRKNSENKVAQLSAGKSIKLSKGTIYINKIEGTKSSKLLIPEGSYSKEYTLPQLAEVFGKNPLPSIPKDFRPASESTNITYDSQGKMLFMSTLSYSKDIEHPESPIIDIKLNKNSLPPKDCLYNTDTLKESVIGSTKVVIGSMKQGDKFNDDGKPTTFYDMYSAEFIYNGVGYNITTRRTDGETFLNLLYSIIK